MIGGEFIVHGAQQEAMIRIASPDFPGVKQFGEAKKLKPIFDSNPGYPPPKSLILGQKCGIPPDGRRNVVP
jgi:hypothetical protein